MYNKAQDNQTRGKTACTFKLPRINAESVAVVGSFNDWSTTANLMQKKEDRWETEVPLPPGRHRYFYFALERGDQTPLRGSVLQTGEINVDGEPSADGSLA
jgi:1,4-alpha-glucan branching enzyme